MVTRILVLDFLPRQLLDEPTFGLRGKNISPAQCRAQQRRAPPSPRGPQRQQAVAKAGKNVADKDGFILVGRLKTSTATNPISCHQQPTKAGRHGKHAHGGRSDGPSRARAQEAARVVAYDVSFPSLPCPQPPTPATPAKPTSAPRPPVTKPLPQQSKPKKAGKKKVQPSSSERVIKKSREDRTLETEANMAALRKKDAERLALAKQLKEKLAEKRASRAIKASKVAADRQCQAKQQQREPVAEGSGDVDNAGKPPQQPLQQPEGKAADSEPRSMNKECEASDAPPADVPIQDVLPDAREQATPCSSTSGLPLEQRVAVGLELATADVDEAGCLLGVQEEQGEGRDGTVSGVEQEGATSQDGTPVEELQLTEGEGRADVAPPRTEVGLEQGRRLEGLLGEQVSGAMPMEDKEVEQGGARAMGPIVQGNHALLINQLINHLALTKRAESGAPQEPSVQPDTSSLTITEVSAELQAEGKGVEQGGAGDVVPTVQGKHALLIDELTESLRIRQLKAAQELTGQPDASCQTVGEAMSRQQAGDVSATQQQAEEEEELASAPCASPHTALVEDVGVPRKGKAVKQGGAGAAGPTRQTKQLVIDELTERLALHKRVQSGAPQEPTGQPDASCLTVGEASVIQQAGDVSATQQQAEEEEAASAPCASPRTGLVEGPGVPTTANSNMSDNTSDKFNTDTDAQASVDIEKPAHDNTARTGYGRHDSSTVDKEDREDELALSSSLVVTELRTAKTTEPTFFTEGDLQCVSDKFLKSTNQWDPAPQLVGKLGEAGPNSMFNIKPEELDIDFNKELGGGNFAQVFGADYQGLAVAAKILHLPTGNEAMPADMLRAGIVVELAANSVLATAGSGLVPCHGAALLPPTHPCVAGCPFCPSTGPGYRVAVVSELCVNGTLSDFIARVKDLTPSQRKAYYVLVAQFILQFAKALQGLHDEQQLLHRDVKGPNLLLGRREGGAVEVFLGDLGLLAGVGSSVTKDFQAGTPEYAAPEALMLDAENSPVTCGVDAFGLGVVAIELLCGTLVGEADFLVRSPRDFCLVTEAHRADIERRCKDAGAPRSLIELAKQLTADAAEERPRMEDVVAWVDDFAEKQSADVSQADVCAVLDTLLPKASKGSALEGPGGLMMIGETASNSVNNQCTATNNANATCCGECEGSVEEGQSAPQAEGTPSEAVEPEEVMPSYEQPSEATHMDNHSVSLAAVPVPETPSVADLLALVANLMKEQKEQRAVQAEILSTVSSMREELDQLRATNARLVAELEEEKRINRAPLQK